MDPTTLNTARTLAAMLCLAQLEVLSNLLGYCYPVRQTTDGWQRDTTHLWFHGCVASRIDAWALTRLINTGIVAVHKGCAVITETGLNVLGCIEGRCVLSDDWNYGVPYGELCEMYPWLTKRHIMDRCNAAPWDKRFNS